MRKSITVLNRTIAAFLALSVANAPVLAQQSMVPAPAKTAAAPAAPAEAPWPLTIKVSPDTTLTLYQPQLDSWDGFTLNARLAARADVGKDKPQSHFGVIELSAHTLTDKGTRMVTISDVQLKKADFPSAGDKAMALGTAVSKDFAGKTRVIALDRLEASLAVVAADAKSAQAPLRNDPPKLVFSTVPAILITVDGAPVYRAISGTSLERVINTRPMLVRDKSGAHYLKVFDGWMTAPSLDAAWTVLKTRMPELDKAFKDANAAHQVDALSGQAAQDQPAPKLADTAPAIYVATAPTELIVTQGEPQYAAIAGTKLLYATNTTGNIFQESANDKTYVLVAGRWFVGNMKSGGWQYVAANALPADFGNIPDDSPKENVKASIPNTPQAKEAMIAASIPQVASVTIGGTKMTAPRIDGEPQWKAIDGTSLSYLANSPTPVIRTAPSTYFAVENGVWFVAGAPGGPWNVATNVPAEIYTIPPSSPLHYVTYVRIYNSTQTTVYVGYTPGYQGTIIDPVSNVVVYGTGYYCDPWIGSAWYGCPVTYGYGATVAYTPWTGWAVAFGFGWMWGAATVAWGWGWGPYPYWGPWAYPAWYGAAFGPHGGAVAWGPGGWAGYTGNIYSQWGNRATVSRYAGGYNAWTGNAWAGKAGASYNSRTGIASAGQRGAVGNVYTGNHAAGSRGVAGGDNFAVAGKRGTAGNAYTGDQISGNRGAIYNKNTGEVTKFGGITGNDGGKIGHVGDDVYAGKDGNIYRNTGDGWQKHEAGGGWNDVGGGGGHGLDQERSARNFGGERTGHFNQSMGAARSFHGGGRGFRR